jgi:PAS domain S-box-containing protein
MEHHLKTREKLITEVEELSRRITELEQAHLNREASRGLLEDGQTEFRHLFEQSRDAFYVSTVDGSLIDGNRAFFELLGYAEEDLIGTDARRLYRDPQVRLQFQREIELTGSVKDFEAKLVRKDGTEIDCLLTSVTRQDENGKVIGYAGTIRDVTDHKKALQALQESNETLRALLDATTDSAFLLDAGGIFLVLNQTTAERLGTTIDQLRFQSAFDCLPDAVAKRRRARFEEALRLRKAVRFEDEREGRIFDVNFSPVVGPGGTIDKIAVFSREITEQKKAEDKLRKAHTELESLVAQRTAELLKANEKLKQEIAERSNAERNLAAELKKFRALYDLAVALTAERSLKRNLSLVVEKSKELLGGDTSYIALRDEKAGDVYMHTLSGIRTDAFKKLRIPFGQGLGGKVAKTSRPCVVKDYFKEIGPLVHDIVRAEGLISGIAVPLQIGQTNLGVLYVFNRNKTSFTSSDVDTLSLLGNLAAVEITRKSAQQQLKEAHANLERQVEERTAQLRKVNEQLELEIVERKKADEALLQSERMLNNILSASPLGIAYFEEARLRWTNQAMAEMFGYQPFEDHLGKNPRDFYASEEEYKRFRDIFLRSLAEMKPAETEAQFKRRDGSIFWGHIKTSALDPSNPMKGTISTITDISARKGAEEALRESEEKYRTIIENMVDVYYEVDLKGNFTFINDTGYRTFGYPREELIGRNFREFMKEEDFRRTSRAFNKVYTTGKSVKAHNMRFVAGDGNERHVEVSISLVSDAAGNVAGYSGICRDVTERKRADEELLKWEKLEYIGVLAGGIAHDFNNILTSILGNISLAEISARPDDSALHRLTEAKKAVQRARDLTQQLLTFSKGGAPIKKPASISDMLRDSCEFALSGSNVRCEFSIAPDLWPVEVDEAQISRVFGNLIINADHAMPMGGVIQVRAENLPVAADEGLPLQDGEYVKVSIKDNGVGIPKEVLPNIFDPYFTTKSRGSGLGLATAYSIAKSHDGILTVESEPGRGTTFYLYLPASASEVKARPDSEDQLLMGSGRVLFMDDEETIRDLAGDLLTRLGYEVETAKNGAEAVDLYRQRKESNRPFDVVMLDLTVPGAMGGKEAMRRLMEIDPQIKAIVSSGYSNDPIMADYLSYGFSGVIPKPYNAQQLSEVLHQVMTRRDEQS